MDCQLCGGTGHTEEGCSLRQTALLDFLNDFRGGGQPGTSVPWTPTSEKVLGAAELAGALDGQSAARPAPGLVGSGQLLPSGQLVDDGPGPSGLVEPPGLIHAAVETLGAGPPHPSSPSPPAPWPEQPGSWPEPPGSWPPPSGDPLGAPWDPRPDRSGWVGPWPPPLGSPIDAPPPPGRGDRTPGGGWPPGRSRSAGRRGRAWMIAASIAAAVAVVAAGAGVWLVSRRAPYPSAWNPAAAPLAAFVAGDVGVSWSHPVAVDFVSEAKLESLSGVAGSASVSQESEAQRNMAAMRAMGLIWGDVSVEQVMSQIRGALTSGTHGFYDPGRHTVYVHATGQAPALRVELVQDLTAALLDQRYGIGRLTAGTRDGEQAVAALASGVATRVQDDYVKAMTRSEQAALGASSPGGGLGRGLPPFLVDEQAFPADFGPALVAGLYQQGGQAAVRAALRQPPSVDGQVIDPASYEPGVPVPELSLPPAPPGSTVIDKPQGFGELPLVELLGFADGFPVAWSAVQGWTTDRSEVYEEAGRVCAVVDVLDDSPGDAAHLAGAAGPWAASLPGASVTTAGSNVTLRSCDPGTGWRPRSTADPYDILQARAFWIASYEVDAHLSPTVAGCVSDRLLTVVGGPTLLAAENAATASDPALAAVEAAQGAAVATCGFTGVPPAT